MNLVSELHVEDERAMPFAILYTVNPDGTRSPNTYTKLSFSIKSHIFSLMVSGRTLFSKARTHLFVCSAKVSVRIV